MIPPLFPLALAIPALFFVVLGGLFLSALGAYYTLRALRRTRKERDDLITEKDVIFNYVQSIGDIFSEAEEVDTEKLLQRVLYYALRTTHAGGGAIYLLGEDRQLHAKAISGVFPPLFELRGKEGSMDLDTLQSEQIADLIRSTPVGVGEGLVGQTANFGTPLLIANAERDPRVPHFHRSVLDVRSILFVPMRFRHEVMGVIVVVNRVDGVSLSERDQSLLQAIADQATVPIYYAQFREALNEKRRLDQDLNMAMRIQARLLPSELPEVPGVELAGFNLPALEVGGDYYDVLLIDDDHIGLAIADVSGKGVGGAIMMSICRSVLRAHGPQHRDPAELLKAVNRAMDEDIYEDMFVTMIYMVYNRRTQVLQVARAGHDAAIVVQGDTGEVVEIGGSGLAIGLIDPDTFDEACESASIRLPPESLAVIYTDGITEAMNAQGEEWGVENFTHTVHSARQLHPNQLLHNIREQVLRFTGNVPQYDDMTVLVIRTVKIENEPKET